MLACSAFINVGKGFEFPINPDLENNSLKPVKKK